MNNGTPGQIKFATDLRARFVRELETGIKNANARASVVADGSALLTWAAATGLILEAARGIDDARFWLDSQRDAVDAVCARCGLPSNETL